MPLAKKIIICEFHMTKTRNYKHMKICNNMMGAGLAIGVGIGVALGSAMNNMGAGIGMGVVIGVAMGMMMKKRKTRRRIINSLWKD